MLVTLSSILQATSLYWCSGTDVNTDAIIRIVPGWLVHNSVSGSLLSPLRGLQPHERQRETVREGGREKDREGEVFIEKWGFAVPFLAMNHFRTKLLCPSFKLTAQPEGLDRGWGWTASPRMESPTLRRSQLLSFLQLLFWLRAEEGIGPHKSQMWPSRGQDLCRGFRKEVSQIRWRSSTRVSEGHPLAASTP